VGEPIAAIVAESREIAEDALEQVVVEYEPLKSSLIQSKREPMRLALPDAGRTPPSHSTSVATRRSSTTARSWSN